MKNFLYKIYVLVFEWLCVRAKPCHGITCLLSESHERRLGITERIRVWFHLSVCSWCRNFNRQTNLLARAVRKLAENRSRQPLPPAARLPDEFREQIKQSIRDNI